MYQIDAFGVTTHQNGAARSLDLAAVRERRGFSVAVRVRARPGQGERRVREAFETAAIVRPSVIIGPNDALLGGLNSVSPLAREVRLQSCPLQTTRFDEGRLLQGSNDEPLGA